MMKHTPIRPNDIRNLEQENDIELMQRIVRACNAHEELVKVLKAILTWDDGNLPGDILDEARKTLTKAEGRQ